MILEIELDNYRGFLKHRIPLRRTSIVVGKNNAGKTTIIEALALISIVVSRSQHSRFISPPDWLTRPSAIRGLSPSLRGIDFEYRNLCFQYRDSPAVIKAKLSGNKAVTIYIHSEREQVFAIFHHKSRPVINNAQAKTLFDEQINILPPIGRLPIRERLLGEEHVRANFRTNLACLHFRNQIHYFGNVSDGPQKYLTDNSASAFPTRYDKFVRFTESTWPNLRIEGGVTTSSEGELNLLVRDGSFVAEIGWVGQGLQAWLQTCWFLARCPSQSTIILDEPDVYLHPDLQRKLFRIVRDRFSQVLIATHSTEILAESNPDNVLVVDKSSKESRFAESLPAVQTVVNNMGGAHNLQLTRLWSARKCIFIEGDDLEFLSAFHEIIFPKSPIALNAIPHISLGGFGNWKHAVGAAIGLRNAGDESIKAYCILDSDFRTNEEHDKIRAEAKRKGLNLHIWSRKEIENYVLVPSSISRFIAKRSPKWPSLEEVKNKIDIACDNIQTDVFDKISNEIWLRDRSNVGAANKEAREIIEKAWLTYDGKITVCPGKEVVSAISAWSQTNFDVSFGALSLAREMQLGELAPEAVHLVTAIENASDLPS